MGMSTRSRAASTIGAATLAVPVQYGLAHNIPKDEIEDLIGVPIEGVFRGAGRVSSHLGPMLMNRIVQDCDNRIPTLDLGQAAPFGLFNGIEHLVLLAQTGTHALQLFEKYFPIFHNAMAVDLDTSASFMRISFGSPIFEQDYGSCNEIALTVFVRLMRAILGDFGRPTEAFIGYEPKGQIAHYQRAYGASVEVRDSEHHFGLVFRRSDVQATNPSHDKMLLAHAEDRALHILENIRAEASSSQLLRLEFAAKVCVRNQKFKIEHITSMLGMTARTAQRVAQANNTSLQKIMDDARFARVVEIVTYEPKISAENLAIIAGCSDERSFRRTLLRWNAMTLRDFRASVAAGRTFKTKPD
ncbi:MAG: AraC family transcriptional regulator ligand-binding domain-containing protein [Pseudomonadota bacterium]